MKKKNLVLLSVILCSIFILSFKALDNNNENSSSPPTLFPNNNISDKFLFGMIHDEETDASYSYSHALQLGLNVSHGYPGWEVVNNRHYPKGRTADDGVLNDISQYAPAVRNILKGVHMAGNRQMFIHRPKIEWLCYGKSSTYQCEEIPTYSTDL